MVGPQAPVLVSYIVQTATVAPAGGLPAEATVPSILPQATGGVAVMVTGIGAAVGHGVSVLTVTGPRQTPGRETCDESVVTRTVTVLPGATDDVIARTFGRSIRAVQRHLHEIMRMVGAQTRFQAGTEAVRRGWV